MAALVGFAPEVAGLPAPDAPGCGMVAQYAAILLSPPAALARLRCATEVFVLPWFFDQALHRPKAAGPLASGPTGSPVLASPVPDVLAGVDAAAEVVVATGSTSTRRLGPKDPEVRTTVATAPTATAAPTLVAKALSPTAEESMAILRDRGLGRVMLLPKAFMASW